MVHVARVHRTPKIHHHPQSASKPNHIHPLALFLHQETHRSHPKQTPSPVAVQHVKVHPDSDSGKHRPKFIRSKHPNNAIHSSPSLILMPEALPTPWIRRCRAWRVSYSCAVHQHNSQPPLINSTIYKLRYIHSRHKYDRCSSQGISFSSTDAL